MSMVWYQLLERYEYAMRVDEDVCLQHVGSNPFAAARDRGLLYGYGLETLENHEETTLTMPAWVREYAADHGLTPPTADVSIRMYFTNYFVSRVDFWRKPEVREYLDAIAASGNVYRHRWGDAPIQSSALN